MFDEQHETPSSAVAAAIRAALLDGRAPLTEFAKGINKSDRTVSGYVAQGMPVEYVGKTPYVVIEPAIAWLRNQRKRDLSPRGRGRPRKSAA